MILPFEGGVLRPLVAADKPVFAKLIDDRSIWLQLTDGVAHPYTEDHADQFFARVDVQPQYVFAITTNGELAGLVGAHPLSGIERISAEIGYWVGAPYQGHGLATKALRTLLPYAFSTLGLHRVQARVFDGNPASMRVLEHCGFRKEGVQREGIIKDGRILDLHLFALLRSEHRS
jgi:[ribosomal protein S5]-alanine N-acetyltransferase